MAWTTTDSTDGAVLFTNGTNTVIGNYDMAISNSSVRESVEELSRELNEMVAQYPMGSMPTGSLVPQVKEFIPPKKSKEKKKKVGVSVAIAHFAQRKAENLKGKLDTEKLTLQTNKKLIEDSQKKVRVMEQKVVNLEEQYNSLAQTKRSELVSKYRKIITLLKKHPEVEKFATDIDKRILITTRPLFVQKDKWKKQQEIGRFQIRIDFSQPDINGGIHILNLTKRYHDYDSPTISNTRPCWGNFQSDLNNEFQTQDLYELVLDLIDYIRSPRDAGGYLGDNGEKSKGWEQFFKSATNQPPNYSFAKHEQLEKSKQIKGVTFNQDIREWEILSTEYNRLSTNPANAGYVQFSTMTAPTPPEQFIPMHVPHASENDYVRLNCLRDLGFSGRAAYYFMGLIAEENLRPREYIDHAELRWNGGEIALFINVAVNLEQMVEGQELIPQNRRILRYFVNLRDLTEEALQRLRMSNSLRMRFPVGLTGTALASERTQRSQAIQAHSHYVGPEQIEAAEHSLRELVDRTQQIQNSRRNGHNIAVDPATVRA